MKACVFEELQRPAPMPSNFIENNDLPKYSKEDILNELEKVLSSDLFSRSSVLTNFLKFIVEETLNENTEDLKEYTIAVGALGKSSDFNPQIDAIVRIHAGRLRRLLNEYYQDSGMTDTIRIELVKGTYVPVFRTHVLNVPKPEAKQEITVKDHPVIYSRSKLTIAILPFRNLCPENEYQFFVDGFGEELTLIFSNFQDIAVIAHHSARKYANRHQDIREIASDLGVHYLITGSVKRSQEDIRVNVGLIKALNGMQIWSHTYNYPLNIESLIDVQDQIVENVCSVLGGHYGFLIHENSLAHTQDASNIDAFDAAFWNYYFHMNFSEEIYLKTREALEKAIQEDPNYPTGLAMLGELYVIGYTVGYPTIKDPINVALELTKKAIRIDSKCQRAHQEYAWTLLHLKRKEEAIKAMEQCLSINPFSVSTMGTIGFGMACVGEYDRANVLLTQSLNLNPHCPWWFYYGFFMIYYKKQDYRKALEYANKIETKDIYIDPMTKAVAKAQLGLYSEAQEDVRLLQEKFSSILTNLPARVETFILDPSLVHEIIEGAKKAGIKVS